MLVAFSREERRICYVKMSHPIKHCLLTQAVYFSEMLICLAMDRKYIKPTRGYRVKSRHSFLHSIEPLDGSAPLED